MARAVRRVFATALGLTVLAVIVGVPFTGRWLTSEDAPQPSDALVVLAGTRAERFLEAVDLYKQGLAPRIVLSPGDVEPAEAILRQRGIHQPTPAEIARDSIVRLGVPAAAVEIMPDPVDNTAAEAAQTHRMARAEGWKTITVITSKYHTRRSRFAFNREFADSGTTVRLRATRYDPSDPPHWWRSRADLRFVGSELEKLVAYRLGLGQ